MKAVINITKIVSFCALLLCSISFNSYSQLEGSLTSKTIMYKKGETFQGTPTTQINTIVWKGERDIQQLILWSSSSLQNITYEITDLSGTAGTITKENLSLRYVKYVLGDKTSELCGYYKNRDWEQYDEMADMLTFDPITTIDASDPIKLLLTSDIPDTIEPGIYSGNVNVKVESVTQVSFEINLQVVDYILPDVSEWSFHLDLWQHPSKVVEQYNLANPDSKIEYWSAEHISLITPLYSMLADMGQKVITAHIKDGALGGKSMVKWIKTDETNWTYDFTGFDAFVELLMSMGISKQINCQSLVGWNSNLIPYFDQATGTYRELKATIGSDEYNIRWNHFLTAFKLHLDTKGWLNLTYLYMDEIEETVMTKVVSLVKSNDKNWKIGLASTSVLSTQLENEIDDLSMVLSRLPANERTGKTTTFYTPCEPKHPNNFVIGDVVASENIWMAWHSMKLGFDGFLRWAYDLWSIDNTVCNDARVGKYNSGDFFLVYRSSNDIDMKFYQSLRTVLIRDGIQDFEKVKVLKQLFQNSTDAYEILALELIDAKINEFGFVSGTTSSVTYLVESAQKLLKDISSGTELNASVLPPENNYCEVGGFGNEYHVGSLTTSGGSTNINFSTNLFPEGGYEFHHNTKLTIAPGDSFDFNLVNGCSWGGCSRVKMWIDWNIDGDFDDNGEEVYAYGEAATCNNETTYSASVSVPADANTGNSVMRIVFQDTWLPQPTVCGVKEHTGATDFVVAIDNEITSNLLPEHSNINKLEICLNPVNNKEHLIVKYNSEIETTAIIGLFDILGKAIVLKKINLSEGQNITKIKSNDIDNGIYILKIQIGNNISESQKIIFQNNHK